MKVNVPEKLKQYFVSLKRPVGMSLFKEHNKSEVSVVPIFNMTTQDDEDTFSFRKWYLCFLDDPTEIAFVDAVLAGNYEVLMEIKKAKRLEEFYKSVRLEAEQRRLALGVSAITAIANDEANKNSFAALKYLCDNGFVEKESDIKRGRPSKAEKQAAVDAFVKAAAEEDEDLQRLQALRVQ